MKILACSDVRVQPAHILRRLIDRHKPDAVLYAGDDLARIIPDSDSITLLTPSHTVPLQRRGLQPLDLASKKLFTSRALEYLKSTKIKPANLLRKLPVPFHYVNGNDDEILERHDRHWLRIPCHLPWIDGYPVDLFETPEKKIAIRQSNMEMQSSWFAIELDSDSPAEFRRHPLVGVFCVPLSPSFGQFTLRAGREKVTVFGCHCSSWLSADITNPPSTYADIFLTHSPPEGILDLSVRHGVAHVGSRALCETVKKHRPRVVVCGHSHFWGGRMEKMGSTTVVNVSSHDRHPAPLNYAIIDTRDWSVELLSEAPTAPRPVRGLSYLRSQLKQLSSSSSKDAQRALEIQAKLHRLFGRGTPAGSIKSLLKDIRDVGIDPGRVESRLASRRAKRPQILKRISFDPRKCAFVDVETGLAKGNQKPGRLWLIGLLWQGEFRQFRYPRQKAGFLKYLASSGIKSLVSWTRYDSIALKPVFEKVCIDVRFIDACQRVSNCVIWHSYSLHEFYDALFTLPGEQPTISGLLAGLYADHLILNRKRCPYCPPKSIIIEQIKERNRLDVLQMHQICLKLWDPSADNGACP